MRYQRSQRGPPRAGQSQGGAGAADRQVGRAALVPVKRPYRDSVAAPGWVKEARKYPDAIWQCEHIYTQADLSLGPHVPRHDCRTGIRIKHGIGQIAGPRAQQQRGPGAMQTCGECVRRDQAYTVEDWTVAIVANGAGIAREHERTRCGVGSKLFTKRLTLILGAAGGHRYSAGIHKCGVRGESLQGSKQYETHGKCSPLSRDDAPRG